jgi:uncharacterized RDD family membrane protein YckC
MPESGGAVTESAETPPPVAPQSGSSGLLPPGLVFADTPSRIAAYVLDSFLLSVLVSIPPALLGLYDYAYTGNPYPEPLPRATFVGVTIFSLAMYAAYFLWFWTGGRRATPGQRVFGIQVGNAFDGRPLTMTQAIERWLAMGWWVTLLILLPFLALAAASYVVFMVWWVILVLSMIRSPTKQGIHDRFARSALVRPAGQGNRWAVGCVWVLIIITILEVAAVVWVFTLLDDLSWPPGLNPLDYMWEQIRTIWPS